MPSPNGGTALPRPDFSLTSASRQFECCDLTTTAIKEGPMPISPERRNQAFEDSISFASFVYGAENFASEFDANYAATKLSAQDLRTPGGTPGGIDLFAIVDAWCPVCVANLPILARIADETGKLRLHVVVRN